MNRFENKVALITGSTQGIGLACALRLASEGADIILNDLKHDDHAESAISQITAMGRRVSFIPANVSFHENVIDLINYKLENVIN